MRLKLAPETRIHESYYLAKSSLVTLPPELNPLVLSLSVVLLHGNENELHLDPAAGALEGLPGPLAI